jgi:hypothetical protein
VWLLNSKNKEQDNFKAGFSPAFFLNAYESY